jgi:transcriptional regulator with GAF, ATPase, and Fis domain
MTTEMHTDCDACAKPNELTHDRVEQALVEADGSVTEAARILNRHRTTVHRFIREHGITLKRQVVVDA